MSTLPPLYPVVPRGPLHYRRRLRRLGPLIGLAAPVVAIGAAAAVWRFWPCPAGARCVARAVVAWGFGALALPTAVLVGLPFNGGTIRVTLVAVTSALVWLAVGFVAGRRATRVPVAAWRDWAREYLWLAVPLWLGVLVGLGGFALIVTRA